MIIRRIQAQNFMRYQALDLSDLPGEGAIAILGENESGKTTIGEAIAFALFGECVKSRASDISQIVSWDADEARVALEFDARGAHWRIERELEKRTGKQAARIFQGEQEVASGPAAVLDSVRGLLGLGFDEFRASFYLAQSELGLVRRGDAEGEGRRAVREIVGIGALERAEAAAREEAALLRAKAEAAAREHAVARALADAAALPPRFGEEIEEEARRLEGEAAQARAALPGIDAEIGRLRGAEAARERAIDAFARLEAAAIRVRADLAARRAGEEAAALFRGLEAESRRVREELQHREKIAQETRARVDRLIDYQAKMAELEARLDIYRLEVRRALEEPAIDVEDVAALEGFAMPTTAAAGLKLAEARVGKLRRARNRAAIRAAAFLIVAAGLATIGLPALAHLSAHGAAAAAPETGIAAYLEHAVERLYSDPARARLAWLGLALSGSGGGLLFLVLGALQIRHALSRTDSLRLAEEARERRRREVKDLEDERAKLERLDLRKPLRFAEGVKDLRNPALRDLFEQIREAHNDFVESPEQGEDLVAKERSSEARLRAEAEALEARLARLARLLKQLPSPGAPDVPEDADPAAIPERLEGIEASVDRVVAVLDGAARDRREAARRSGGGADDPERALEDLLASADSFRERTRLREILRSLSALEPEPLREALAAERELLVRSLPDEADLRASIARAEAERRAAEATLARAEARLRGLSAEIEETRAKRMRAEELERRARALGEALAPLERAVEVRSLAADLLHETAEDVRRRVGPTLARYAAAVLPRLTEGRYRRVKVSPDLEVRVYSTEKNDYVPLVDLSVGAADQLLLSLRLALGRALVAANGLEEEKHFLFLDEPLASFDAERARAFLEILSEHADRFPQVFIVAHLHIQGLDEAFARVISPSLETRQLATSAAAPDGRVESGAPQAIGEA